MRMGDPMKRNILLAAALFTIATSTLAQTALPAAPATSTPYGADSIGETLIDYAVNTGIKADKNGRYPGVDGCQMTASKTVTCEKVEGGNGVAFRTTFYVFINLTLDHIESRFERNQYATTRAAIVKKYGPPTRTTTESYTTYGGADLQGELADWEQPGSVILLNECESWGSSNFIISNPVRSAAATAAELAITF
jgi:hypothetical protein